MRGLKVRCCVVSHYSQHRGDGALPWGKDGTRDKDFHVWPHGFRKYRRKDRYDTDELSRQSEHRDPFVIEARCAFTACRF
jgi:hypothetical protein